MSVLERWIRGSRGVVKASVLAATLYAATPASAQELVNFGDTIDEPGVYFLNGNQHGSGVGLVITADDVALFMFRFTLRNDVGAPPAVGPIGIVISGCDNVNIFGGRVTGFTLGISMGQSTNCTIKDTRVDHNEVGGIEMSLVSNSSFVRVRTDHNGNDGIAAYDSTDNRFFSVRSDENDGNGILLRGQIFPQTGRNVSDGNSFKKCWLAYNGANGLELRDADDNTVEENQCVANDWSGILLTGGEVIDWLGGDPPPPAADGSDGNRIARNWCPLNRTGISVEELSTDNHLVENVALANFVLDAFDGNDAPPCANTWFLNTFLFRGGDGALCIF